MTQDERQHQMDAFIKGLQTLSPGDRARLKRRVGHTLGESQEALGIFYRALPAGVPPYQHEAYFLIATLYPLATDGGQGNLGDTLRRARVARNSAGLDRRVEYLLNADRQQLPFRLRQAVRFAESCRVRVNFPQLLNDVLDWTHPAHYVQLRWAESYFTATPSH